MVRVLCVHGEGEFGMSFVNVHRVQDVSDEGCHLWIEAVRKTQLVKVLDARK